MSRTLSVDAVILRTIDIGEADRFCILFTRQHGRKAARARAVRKTTSRLGAMLLPFRSLKLELHETDHSLTITSAVPLHSVDPPSEFSSVLALQQGIELLLALTEDDEVMPAVFDLLQSFISSADQHALIPFQLRLLHLLGLLPAVTEYGRFDRLDPSTKVFIEACTQIPDISMLMRLPYPRDIVQKYVVDVLSEHLSAPLRSTVVASLL